MARWVDSRIVSEFGDPDWDCQEEGWDIFGVPAGDKNFVPDEEKSLADYNKELPQLPEGSSDMC